MAVFEYKAFNASGKQETGIVDAESAKAARVKLRKQGVFPTELVEEKAGGDAKKTTAVKRSPVEVDVKKLFGGGRVGTQDLAIMTRQLATLLAAGISMIEAL